ncbi:uncharacterized protein HaLaN_12217, partial [Haematococcus lacustris]
LALLQVADEELSLGRAATSFALDMLVEAVASSQDRFHISSDAIRPRLQALSQQQQHWQEDEAAAEDSIVGPASQPVQGNLRAVRGGLTTTGTTLPQRDFKFGDTELFDDDDVYGVTRLFDRPKLRRGAKQQYVLALKAVLQVQKAAAIREQPRLAARPCVWRSRRVPPRKLAWAPFSGDEAVQAAVQEAQFWEKVVMTPFWLNQDR